MQLTHLDLSQFRSYQKESFSFSNATTVIVGPNTAGKTNFLEAIYLLATGKSFKAENDQEMVHFNQEFARITGMVKPSSQRDDTVILETLVSATKAFHKRYKVNNVPRRRIDFAGNLLALLFLPSDLELIVGSPATRRSFLDYVLDLTDREYRIAHTAYQRALRQRNALLTLARETGRRNTEQFAYWDEMLIHNGSVLTAKREAFIAFCNSQEKAIASCQIVYDHSKISEARLVQYSDAEIGAGVTLVGPHRDDFSVTLQDGVAERDVKAFGSRGQQRLVVLQLKLMQLSWIESVRGERPVLLLDDIFSELDSEHIELVLAIIGRQQTLITTTHKEFLRNHLVDDVQLIELSR
jgi:DNA replication and repair protein RecF